MSCVRSAFLGTAIPSICWLEVLYNLDFKCTSGNADRLDSPENPHQKERELDDKLDFPIRCSKVAEGKHVLDLARAGISHEMTEAQLGVT